jgi:hypothetical protein
MHNEDRILVLALGLSLVTSACASHSPVREQWVVDGRDQGCPGGGPERSGERRPRPRHGREKSGEAVASGTKGQRNQATRQAPAITISGGE